MKRRTLALAVGMLVFGLGRASALGPMSWSSAEIAHCIRDHGCRPSFVVAHRANGFGMPEDSRAAVRAAIGAGVPIVEIDLRSSADGRIVVLHDPTLNRTTSMRGDVKGFTAGELGRALLANGETLPSFEEIYALSRGKAVLDLRFHVNVIEQAVEWIALHGSFDDVIFFAISDDLAKTTACMRLKYPAMMVMAKAQNWGDAEKVNALFARPPEILHPDTINPEFDRQLHAHGIKTFRNLMAPAGAGSREMTIAAQFLGKGFDFLQTDEPALFLERLPGLQVRASSRP